MEYALKTSAMPIGVATYNLSPELPEAYKELLPTSEDIAKKLEVLIKELRNGRFGWQGQFYKSRTY